MFDKDGNGTISVNEFQQLWTYMNQWKGTFDRIDANRSGSIESHELCAGNRSIFVLYVWLDLLSCCWLNLLFVIYDYSKCFSPRNS